VPTETPRSIAVRKYGSSLLKGEDSLDLVVQDIGCALDGRTALVVVTSAFAGETDRLLASVRRVGGDAASHEAAAYIASGEERTAHLLTLALARSGIRAATLRAEAVGIRTEGDPLDASIDEVRPLAILEALERADVVVVPGFVGTHRNGRVALLGRGGSDLTAIELAAALEASSLLVKDVPGIDRREAGDDQLFAALGWSDALRYAGKSVQPKALRAARTRRQPFTVGQPFRGQATKIGALAFPKPAPRVAGQGRPQRVALLGCGVVGRGVLERLASFGDRFEVIGIAVRDPAKHAASGIDPSLLSTDAAGLAAEADIVVEALGGVEPALGILRSALADGRHVVTANKSVIARAGDEFATLAAASGARLAYGAAVGGATPCLELIEAVRSEGIESIEGVLNGTANSILEATANGLTRREALAAAQAAGFAEADPERDLDGTDAAEKLAILARAAWGCVPDPIAQADVRHLPLATLRRDWGHGCRYRQVACVRRSPSGLQAAIEVQPLAAAHPLYDLPGAWNGIVVRTARGHEYTAYGQGAGRWPTTLAVVRDLLALPHAATARPLARRSAS